MDFPDWWLGQRKAEGEVRPLGAVPPNDDVEAFDRTDHALEATGGRPRPLLYMFQYVVLREAAFQNHPELIRELEGKRSMLPLLHFQSKAHLRCIEAGLIDPYQQETDAGMEAESKLFEAVAVHPHKRNGYTAHVVSMPQPESPLEAHFVAIVHKDDEPKRYRQASPSTRYFTLEKSLTALPLLCEHRPDGSRTNYGERPSPDMGDFVGAVFERVHASKTGSNRILLEEGYAAVMMFAPRSSTDYHLVCVEFEDGTRLSDARVYRMCELELPPQFIGKKILRLALNASQP